MKFSNYLRVKGVGIFLQKFLHTRSDVRSDFTGIKWTNFILNAPLGKKTIEIKRQNCNKQNDLQETWVSCQLRISHARVHWKVTSHIIAHLFMLTHEVSKIPISLCTASKISRITSGGMRKERISERDSGLMSPTASFASFTSGSISDNSISIAFFRFSNLTDSSPCFCFSVSISLFDSLARYVRGKHRERSLGCNFIQPVPK